MDSRDEPEPPLCRSSFRRDMSHGHNSTSLTVLFFWHSAALVQGQSLLFSRSRTRSFYLLGCGLPEEPLPHTFSMFQKLVVQEVHRNTYRNSSRMLKDDLKIKTLYTGFCTVSVQARGLNTP